ncbi:MAG: uroporphyrinogen decarboxylase [Pseudomonadota bacterium]
MTSFTPSESRFHQTLSHGRTDGPPPIWLMRQAGRYLPEYRATREQAGGFLDLCYKPELACEVTLQPIRRYAFDASILFADILIVPDALGQKTWFEPGEGPRLEPVKTRDDIAALSVEETTEKFASICESVRLIRAALPQSTALIGFCGAPWTVATYSVGGRGSPDQAAARTLAFDEPETMQALIDTLVDASIRYLNGQIDAGADTVQIFDTWAGSLPDDQFERWSVAPTKAIVDGVRAHRSDVPIIGFPRQAGTKLARYVEATGVDGVGCDTTTVLAHAVRDIDPDITLQGNLDPLLLVAGGDAMHRRIDDILAATRDRRFIFNLGHGIVPQTPPEHVAELVAHVRGEALPTQADNG